MAARGGLQRDRDRDAAESPVYLFNRLREEKLNTNFQKADERHAPAGTSILLAITLGAFAVGLTGCWMAALQLAPVAIGAAGAVGDGVMNMASNSSASKDLHPGEDEVDRHERCDNLAETAPTVIELRRTVEAAAPQWRELQIANDTGEPRWSPASGTDGGGTLRPTANLLAMNFAPPLALPSGANIPTYLGYAPSEPVSNSEQDELSGLTANFGAPIGTFQWNGRVYQYSTAARLPCFPPAVAMK
jgi:hypothetical protein